MAKLYQDKFMDMNLYDDSYDSFCEKTGSENAEILDIGCGPGNITKYLLNKMPGFRITGVDVSPNMIALAKVNNPTAAFTVMDCREIDQLPTKFDGIVCGFCLPYLSRPDCAKLVKDCACLLNDHGIVYLSFVEGEYSHSGFLAASTGDRTFFHFHSLDSLTKELTRNQFDIIEVFNKSYKRNDATEEVQTIIIAKKYIKPGPANAGE